jgi:hypothetical protein
MKETYKYNDFLYIKDYSNEGSPIVEHNVLKPEYVYKFYSLSKYSIAAFVDGYLYASSPLELNDILDSSPFLMYTSEKLEFDQYKKLFESIYEDVESLRKYYDEDSNRDNLCKGYISTMYDIATNLLGIISMTGKEFNTLMWPHYTQEQGFQLKFNTEKLEKSIENKIVAGEEYLGFYPVHYSEVLSPIDIHGFKTLSVPLYYATNIKSKHWEYENEWRFIIGKPNMGVPHSKKGLDPRKDYFVKKENRYVYYDQGLVEEITLGTDFFNGRNFELEWLDEKQIKIKPIKIDDDWRYESFLSLLNFIVEKHSNKLFYSGIKYERDERDQLFIIRTKEKLEISKISEDVFILTRTNVVKT